MVSGHLFHNRKHSWPAEEYIVRTTLQLLDYDSAAPPEQAWRRKLDSHANRLKEFTVTFSEAIKMVRLGIRLWSYVREEASHGRKAPIDPFTRERCKPSASQGVPLGGMGSGSISRGFRGEFKQWQIIPGICEASPVMANQFSIFISRGLNKKYASVLAPGQHEGLGKNSDHGISSWGWNLSGQHSTYHALFPRAWTIYDGEPDPELKISCRQISPFIPHNYRESSLPVSVFVYTLVNTGKERAKVSLLFTWANSIGGNSHLSGDHVNEPFLGDDGVSGVLLHHKTAKGHPPVTFAVAACETQNVNVTVLPCFGLSQESNVTAKDMWGLMSQDGQFDRRNFDSGPSMPSSCGETLCAAVSASAWVEPHGKCTVSFAVAWSSPKVKFSKGSSYNRRYTKYYGTSEGAAQNIVHDALTNYRRWEEDIEKWQNPILHDARLPEWYKFTLFNELYFLVAGGTVWIEMATSSSTPVDSYDPTNDPNRKPKKSSDPGWKYAFWPDLNKKDVTKCTRCNKEMHGGIGRLKRHLIGGYSDVADCKNTSKAIVQELRANLEKGLRKKAVPLDDDLDDIHEIPSHDTSSIPDSRASSSSSKRQKTLSFPQSQLKATKTIASMIRKSPEEVVEERHSKGPYQTTIDNSTKTEEEKRRLKQYIADFFYENGIPFNAAHSRSYEIMVEAIGQFGSGAKPPSYHELRVPCLETAKMETNKLRERHEKSWKLYGCTLMCDGWTDKRTRHLINFLANGQEGTFFLSSVDVSSKVQDANMLADLIEEQINLIGKEYVVQVVTDNGANFKAACGKLCQRIPTLFWTPCAAHCLDLMLEDIAKLKEFKVSIVNGRNITTFIYRHHRLLSAMREQTNGADLVRPGATRFATAFLTLQSLYKHKNALRKLFGGSEWFDSKLSKSAAGGKVHDAVLSKKIWNNVADCIRASQPLLVVLRIVDGDEKPALAEICAAMDIAKEKIIGGFEQNPRLLAKVIGIVERRWNSQMEVDLYGAAYFLNPGLFFDLKEKDFAYSSRLRMKFNDVLTKMIPDITLMEKISNQVDHYENSRKSFGKELAVNQRKSKCPLDWWGAFGGDTIELVLFAKRIVGLCCSSSGCERNWSTFEFIHTKKRNRLEHQRLNDLVFVQYNRKIASRYQKRREEGDSFNPLILEDFQWDNEWVTGDIVDDNDELWDAVDIALDASQGLDNRRSSRRSGIRDGTSSFQAIESFEMEMEEDDNYIILNDDEDIDDDFGIRPTPNTSTNEIGVQETDEVELDLI